MVIVIIYKTCLRKNKQSCVLFLENAGILRCGVYSNKVRLYCLGYYNHVLKTFGLRLNKTYSVF